MGKARLIEQPRERKAPKAGTKAAEILRHRKLMLAIAEVMAAHGFDHEHIANMVLAIEACDFGEINVRDRKRESSPIVSRKMTKADAGFLRACGVKVD